MEADMKGLTDRVALITGASRGIGAATAVLLAEAGADVAINYHANRDAAEQVAEKVRSFGRRAEVYQADITSWDDCKCMTEAALEDFGKVDILVNNAGIGYETYGTPLLTDTDPADMQRFISYNTLGCLYMIKLIVPQMRALERGNVVMVSSFSAQALRAHMGSYSVSKAGMEALALTLAKEEREHGIRVNIVAPGLVDTDMGDGFLDSHGDLQRKDKYAENAPFGYICTPEDVAGAVLYLCSDESRYVTGQRLTVNGGGY
jgi:NAD(P)-dependent dehydrogenase (short-subunit alcohol dehydrogenase family)